MPGEELLLLLALLLLRRGGAQKDEDHQHLGGGLSLGEERTKTDVSSRMLSVRKEHRTG